MAENQIWEVVGGEEKGGIMVRVGMTTSSRAEGERLSTGALVRELKLVNDRMLYQRLTGTGPSSGWVSTNVQGKDLLVRSDKDAKAGTTAQKESADKPAEPSRAEPAAPAASSPKPEPVKKVPAILAAAADLEKDIEVKEIPEGATTEELVKELMEERKARAKLEKQVSLLMSTMSALQSRVINTPDLWKLGKREPEIHPTAFIAPGAAVIGTVRIKKNASIWFNCTVRGDNEQIEIGEDSDIQDNSVLHADEGKPLIVGKNVLVGHQVCLHGCRIGENCLIGMRSVILDDAVIGNNVFVAAGSQIPENRKIPDNSFVQGNPCKVAALDTIMPGGLAMLKGAASTYVVNKDRFLAELQPVEDSSILA